MSKFPVGSTCPACGAVQKYERSNCWLCGQVHEQSAQKVQAESPKETPPATKESTPLKWLGPPKSNQKTDVPKDFQPYKSPASDDLKTDDSKPEKLKPKSSKDRGAESSELSNPTILILIGWPILLVNLAVHHWGLAFIFVIGTAPAVVRYFVQKRDKEPSRPSYFGSVVLIALGLVGALFASVILFVAVCSVSMMGANLLPVRNSDNLAWQIGFVVTWSVTIAGFVAMMYHFIRGIFFRDD